MLAFVAEHDRVAHLYLRHFDQLRAVQIASGRVSGPFFSPDGQWIGFFSGADNKLKKVSVAGGNPVAVCDLHVTYPRGASWGDDDYIVFNPSPAAWTKLLRVAAGGGSPEPLSTLRPGEVAHRWPQVLPGGKAVLFIAYGTQGGVDASTIEVQPLPQGPSRVLLRGPPYAR